MPSAPSHDPVSVGHSSANYKMQKGVAFSRQIRRQTVAVDGDGTHKSEYELSQGLRLPEVFWGRDEGGHADREDIMSARSSAELSRLRSDDEEGDQDNDDEIAELRDGFFDAVFLQTKDSEADRVQLLKRAERTLPLAFLRSRASTFPGALAKQWRDLGVEARHIFTTRSGLRLFKAFIAFFVAYVLCLIPWVRAWLGRYNYMMVVSTIINHPARTVGSQIDGAIGTTMGTATGLGWGAFGLWLSTSSTVAASGFGAILAVFLFLCIGAMAALRSRFVRLYQFSLCSGIAVIYTCLTEVSGQGVVWKKLYDFGIPWVLGQAICLVTCVVWFPDAGARGLATALNNAFGTMLDGLDPRKFMKQRTRRQLAQTFIHLSQAYRDIALDITVTLFNPKDVQALRNSLQAVVRSLLALKAQPAIFGPVEPGQHEGPEMSAIPATLKALVNTTALAAPGLSEVRPGPLLEPIDSKESAVRLVRYQLDEPTRHLLRRMKEGLQSCHGVLMDMSGYRRFLGPPDNVQADVPTTLVKLRKAMITFDEAESALLEGDELASKFVPEVIEIFAYCRPIRQAASTVEAVLVKVNEMEQRRPKWPKVYLPSYPWHKALGRSNAQARHDRGGMTATSFYKSFADISRLIQHLKSDDGQLEQEPDLYSKLSGPPSTVQPFGRSERTSSKRSPTLKKSRFRYSLWEMSHSMQGFEMRFALKTAVVVSLLAMPAWLAGSRDWWNEHESFWAVVMAWIMMHPRVGGNLQDLATRALTAVLGAVWSGAAFAAAGLNPYVMAAFAALYMTPMLYRFTQTAHPRSGLVGCLSFTVTSLALITDDHRTSVAFMTTALGVAMVVGVVASVAINWIIWPFIARHELRKALASMMFFLSITYSSIIGRYVYYDEGHGPTAADIERSEVLEGRLREGFVRIRQLMALTRHEVRLRAPFDPRPYSGMADSCERFFEFLVAVRQSALFFHPSFIRDNTDALECLLTIRRDAVAAVLMNLYILAGALRSNSKVPRYLPSAAAARRRLKEKMAALETEYEDDKNRATPQLDERKKWVQIYSYSYNESLTGCVSQLEALERYTKMIVGEQGFDNAFQDNSSDMNDDDDGKN